MIFFILKPFRNWFHITSTRKIYVFTGKIVAKKLQVLCFETSSFYIFVLIKVHVHGALYFCTSYNNMIRIVLEYIAFVFYCKDYSF